MLIFSFRIGHFLYKKRIPLIPKLITYFNRLIWSCYLPTSLEVGDNLILGYQGLGIVIHNRSKIGNNCHIDQNVTIGGTTKKYQVPILGDNVYVGAGAKILGPIKIGDNVIIGANSVVISDIPSNSLVVGIPGKVVRQGVFKSDYV